MSKKQRPERITYRIAALAELHEDPANVRRHGKKNVAAIRASLKRFGQVEPLVVQAGSGKVIGGNGRLSVMRELGWEECQIAEVAIDDTQSTALAIALNRTGELAEWDEEGLAQMLRTLSDAGEADGLGFDDGDINDLLGALDDGNAEVTEDEPGDPPANPVSIRGDLWILGDHRLLCGDSTKREDTNRLMAGSKADMLLSDPPYGVSYVGKTSEKLTVENDDMGEEELAELVGAAFGNAQESCRLGAYWYATVPAGPLHILFAQDWKTRGVLRQIMVWAKDSMVLGHSEYHYQHEPILFGWLPGGSRHKNSDRTRTTLWVCDRPKASREHPTMKPVELWARALKDGSRPGEIVLDPFLGSGTTLIAAEQLGRKCYGMEISPQYCDVIVNRWQKLTGKTAILDGDLRSFAEISAERAGRDAIGQAVDEG